MEAVFRYISGADAADNSEILEKCSALFSNHYGVWGPLGPRPMQHIVEKPEKIRQHLLKPDTSLYYAVQGTEIIGYAIASIIDIPDPCPISWVTQLVVHERHRRRGIATTLLQAIFGMSNRYAWGIVSSNAFSVRALEKATRRRCQPELIARRLDTLIEAAQGVVDYIPGKEHFRVEDGASAVNTHFYTLPETIKKNLEGANEQRPWQLGDLKDGEEWFAFTFNDQEQTQLSPAEIRRWLKQEQKNVQMAYSRMVHSPRQTWAQYTEKEADQIVSFCGLNTGDSVLDIGCGTGRHSQALADRGLNVTGVDCCAVVPESAEGNPAIIRDDGRDFRGERLYDAVICLYDVIGSYIDNQENLKLLQTISRNLKPRGRALISVMNFALTERQATRFVDIDRNGNDIFNIPPSQTMETTGNVFNPDYYVVDRRDHVVYRREQFLMGNRLPTELLVCDHRFTVEEIHWLCIEAGLNILGRSYVRAGDWETNRDPCDQHAKEILLLCERMRDHFTFSPENSTGTDAENTYEWVQWNIQGWKGISVTNERSADET